MFKLQINDKKNFLTKKHLLLIKKAVNSIYKNEKLEGVIVFELHLIGDFLSKKINLKYRNKNYPTDVISFSFWEKGLLRTPLLGEIYLNYNKVIQQSKKYKHKLERELIFLVSHGVYHLLGYDHINPDDEKIMLTKQYEILKICHLDSENDWN